MKKKKIIISGGGTGGHVFPAIAIADELRKVDPNIEILFVGAKGKIEMEKVPKAGYPIKGLWISGFQRKLTFRNLLFPVKLFFSLIKANKIIRKFKPDIAIGVGGYASGPLLKMAEFYTPLRNWIQLCHKGIIMPVYEYEHLKKPCELGKIFDFR